MLSRLERARQGIVPQVGVIASEKGEEIIKLVQRQLYETGTNADGKKLKPYRNPTYARMKNAMNGLVGMGTPDFYLTGETYRQMRVEAESGQLRIVSFSDAFPDLIKRDGERPFDMNAESKHSFRKSTLYPEERKYIAGITGTKLKT